MADPHGDKLYVNLGASQARRRLKGFGHGVRKVQTAGRNRAVILHTATGRHLDRLKSQFTDVGCSVSEGGLEEPIERLPNLGPASAAWLREAGIRNVDELRQLGPAFAFRLVRRQQPRAGLLFLWALAAGLEGRDWRDLTDEEKSILRAQAADD